MHLPYEANMRSYDDFLSSYEQALKSGERINLNTLLEESMGNTKGGRVPISHRLLDDGANAQHVAPSDGFTYLHILFVSNVHDIQVETPLLQRLLEDGADINHVARKKGTPLQALASASNFRFSDDDLAPFYDVIFARDDLDLLKIGRAKKSTYASISGWVPERAQLVERMNTYLTERSIPIPNTQETMTE